MFIVIGRFLRWLFDKFAVGALIAALALTACALWLFLKDNVDFDEWRKDVVRTINGEREKVKEAMADVHQRMDRISAEITAEQDRGKQTDKVIAQLRDLESTWDKLVGNREQQKANAEQLAKMLALRAELAKKVKALQLEFTRTTWERDGLEIALGKIDTRLKVAEVQQSRLRAGVGFQFQRVGILPGDVHSRRHAHQPAGAVRLAASVHGGRPGIGDLPPLIVQWNAGVVALGRRHHPPSPLFVDDRDPVAGQIDRRGGLRGLGLLLPTALRSLR